MVLDKTQQDRNLYYLFLGIYLLYTIMKSITFTERIGFEEIFLFRVFFVILALVYRKPSFLFLVALTSLIDIWPVLPSTSNSILMGFILNICIVVTFVGNIWKHKSWDIKPEVFYNSFAPGGRLLLLTMYFFGIFQKLNTSFLDPGLSYAVLLLDYTPFLPSQIADNILVQYSAIYGTFIIEGGIIIALLTSKYRYWGIVGGVLFHMFLSVNEYSPYMTFSCLSFALHFLFLSPYSFEKFKTTLPYKFFTEPSFKTMHVLMWGVGALIYISCLFIADISTDRTFSRVSWVPLGLFICWLAIICDYKQENQRGGKSYFLSNNLLLTATVLLFFISCFSPYIGLKNAQSLSMFSGLKVEGGSSNHLVIREPYYIFDHLTHPVNVISTNLQNERIRRYQGRDTMLPSFLIEYHMARNPDASIVYKQNGQTYSYPDGIPEELQEKWQKPTILYKLLSFRPIDPPGARGY